ncbi:unnamed protein product [Ectocarpus sp. 8 AP-2014]
MLHPMEGSRLVNLHQGIASFRPQAHNPGLVWREQRMNRGFIPTPALSPQQSEACAGRGNAVHTGVLDVPGMSMGQALPGESIVASMHLHADGKIHTVKQAASSGKSESMTLINTLEGRKMKDHPHTKPVMKGWSRGLMAIETTL